MENWKQATGNRKPANFAGFACPVFGFLFFIPCLIGSGSGVDWWMQ